VDLTEKLSESEKLMKEMSQTWEEKLQKTGELLYMSEEQLRSPVDRPCGLVVRVPGCKSRSPGLIPGITRFSEK
jgi:hypothetical protein